MLRDHSFPENSANLQYAAQFGGENVVQENCTLVVYNRVSLLLCQNQCWVKSDVGATIILKTK